MVANEADGRAEALRRIAACRTTQAEELDLGGLQLTALDGELLAALCRLNLTSLDLRNNSIGAEGALALKSLVNLTNLNLARNDIGAEGVQALKGLVNLSRLDLARNDTGAEGAQVLKGLVNLTTLNLVDNGIGD
jgi:Leucine-rich repeat (LRR) protein